MTELILSRWQFGITSIYHFLFVPMTLGLSVLLAVLETCYLKTGKDVYLKLTRFWGKIFIILFSMGVVTGIVQEFHFGMNWSEYSRFMGDIFGAPLALEALTAFFLESTFLGLWLFGWDKLPKKIHALCIWLVAIGGNISAYWILVANSFMQHPVGYVIQNNRAEMTDFWALLTNSYVFYQFPHTVLSGLVTAGLFVMAVSAYHLLKKSQPDCFLLSFKWGTAFMVVGLLFIMGSGHFQMQHMAKAQPMKLAAAEALWESADPAPFAVIAIPDEVAKTNSFELKIPGLLTLLAYNRSEGEIKGLNNLQAEYAEKYGAGEYMPPVMSVFTAFRIMVGCGSWLLLLGIMAGLLLYKGKLTAYPLLLKAILVSLPVPFLANSAGWFVTEVGRQPWMVFGLQKLPEALSPNLSVEMVLASLVGFTLLYGVLAVIAVYLVKQEVKKGIVPRADQPLNTNIKGASLWN